jgi:hypothetical protein
VPSFGNLTEDQGLPGQSSVNPSEKVFNCKRQTNRMLT